MLCPSSHRCSVTPKILYRLRCCSPLEIKPAEAKPASPESGHCVPSPCGEGSGGRPGVRMGGQSLQTKMVCWSWINAGPGGFPALCVLKAWESETTGGLSLAGPQWVQGQHPSAGRLRNPGEKLLLPCFGSHLQRKCISDLSRRCVCLLMQFLRAAAKHAGSHMQCSGLAELCRAQPMPDGCA